MLNPLVSVLMTAYNREQYIAEAIESALGSTYKNFELIIVDDGSTDNTVNIARSFEEKDSRIKVYINDKNLGDYPNRNRAAGYANGEFIMYLDSDDTIFSDGIENCLKAMLSYPGVNFGMFATTGNKDIFKLESAEALRIHLFKRPFLLIGPGGTIIRKKFFESINGYPELYGPANDLYFNLKACCRTGIVIMPFKFLFYRRHGGQEINNQFSYFYNTYRYFRDALEELALPVSKQELAWLDSKNKRRFVVNVIKHLLKNGSIRTTLEAVRRAEFSFMDALSGIFHK